MYQFEEKDTIQNVVIRVLVCSVFSFARARDQTILFFGVRRYRRRKVLTLDDGTPRETRRPWFFGKCNFQTPEKIEKEPLVREGLCRKSSVLSRQRPLHLYRIGKVLPLMQIRGSWRRKFKVSNAKHVYLYSEKHFSTQILKIYTYIFSGLSIICDKFGAIRNYQTSQCRNLNSILGGIKIYLIFGVFLYQKSNVCIERY